MKPKIEKGMKVKLLYRQKGFPVKVGEVGTVELISHTGKLLVGWETTSTIVDGTEPYLSFYKEENKDG